MTLIAKLKHLEDQHQILNKKIDGLESTGVVHSDLLNKLKKQRLHLKDDLVRLKTELDFRARKANGST
jgi:uncharacterized protein YdcH (DUF465 family)|tara:strand:+ start:291 stop:494 length:204 start_codon:yes stop_codon:yes gene_type:complete